MQAQLLNKKFTNPDGRDPVGGLAGRLLLSAIHMRDDGDRGKSPSFLGRRFARNIAIHEAAHAVTSRLLGLPIAGCTINFIDGHHGLTWASDAALQPDAESVSDLVDQLSPLMPRSGEDRSTLALELQRAGDLVISLLAGIEAERLFTVAPLANTEHDEDEARAIASLICRSPRSIDSYLDFCRAEAVALLTDNRNIVMALADELIRYRTLDGEQIDEIIRAATLCHQWEAG
jgi:hypothetical protein